MWRKYMTQKTPLPIMNRDFFIYETDEKLMIRLPEKGWMQQCFLCSMITSKTISYKIIPHEKKYVKIIYDIKVYCCPSCIRKMDKCDEYFDFFKESCDYFLDENFPSM